MTVLVVGASGATGRLLVAQLLQSGQRVKAVVRSAQSLPEILRRHENLDIVEASLLDLDDSAMDALVEGCKAVVSCLGHNLTFKGVYGHPRRLVTDATRRLCLAVSRSDGNSPVKFVLMNSTGCKNRDLNEPISFAQKLVIGLLRLILPPHVDNEQAGEFLRTQIGQKHDRMEWIAVRPDGLIDQDEVTDYDLYQSPIRSPIFDPGKTSRINVANFMSRLIGEDDLWQSWKGQMPVIYNA